MDEKILLRVWSEFESTGIWIPPIAGEPPAGVNISYESLDLPDDLVEAFTQWQERYSNRRLPDDGMFDWEAFGEEGLNLAKRLKIHLFYKADVEYEFDGFHKIYGYQVMADYMASLWSDEPSSCALEDIEDDLQGYSISDRDALQQRFYAWERKFDDVALHNEGWESFNQEGEALVEELQNRLPLYCVVFYNKAYEEEHPQWWKKD